MAIAHQFLSYALRYDYLSNSKGHQQSRRVIADRREKRSAARQVNALLGTGDAGLPVSAQTDTERAYFNRVALVERLTSREEYVLAKRTQAGDEAARNALVEANLGLTVMLAQRYRREGLPLMDLIAEGNFGLMAATRTFDPERGFRFATYAKWAVRQSIERSLPRLLTVRQATPKRGAHKHESDANDGAACATTPAANPDINLAAFDDSSLQADTAPASLLELDESTELAPDGHERDSYTVRRPGQNHDSYTARGQSDASDEEALLQLTIPEEEEPPSTTQTTQRNECLARALACLTDRERTVICERFALAGTQAATLDQLARRLHVSIERVRQIECAAVKKLATLLTQAGESADTLL